MCSAIFYFIYLLIFCVIAAPPRKIKSWPPMKNFDIWGSNKEVKVNSTLIDDNYMHSVDETKTQRIKRVLNFFPVPVDDECLSSDGRRSGICLNVYECRIQGGAAQGKCALGFGVCCVFVVTCGQFIKNNMTYVVSPQFPNYIPTNLTSCHIKIKLISPEISQLRIDFNHFLMGQPNRLTGVCDGDIFSVIGGIGKNFSLCGQNSGQHVYYDVEDMKQFRQDVIVTDENYVFTGNISDINVNNTNELINDNGVEILINFTRPFVTNRLLEFRVTQIPFSQRAPSGCLQYFTEPNGIIQTFNFAENGRHLANQNYRVCIRQEMEMCSIAYQPCYADAFKIGPSFANNSGSDETYYVYTPAILTSTTTANTIALTMNNVELGNSMSTATVPMTTISATTQPSVTEATSIQTDEVEGSGDGNIAESTSSTTKRPGSGGFDIFSFLRDTFDFGRKAKQMNLPIICQDRITLPCIVEDFIDTEIGSSIQCEPVHCGQRFCSTRENNCRIESSVIPFSLGIHFGDGIGKGSPDENIGACLMYSQVPCF